MMKGLAMIVAILLAKCATIILAQEAGTDTTYTIDSKIEAEMFWEADPEAGMKVRQYRNVKTFINMRGQGPERVVYY
mgnify:CR=1 FL=1